MMSGSKLALIAFLLLLAAGVAYGVAYDLGSRARGIVRAYVVESRPSKTDFKSSSPTPAKLTARLSDGTIVQVRAGQTTTIAAGSEIEIIEMVSPWGQTWYQLKN